MRLQLGSLAPDFVAESIGGRRVSLEQLRGRPVLLKFYRFATCPICNLHMHRFIQEHQMVSDAGLTTVVLYHSPADKLAEAQDYATPFDLVPDAEKKIFRAYGVERGLRGFVSPAVMREYVKALRAGYSPGLTSSDGGVTGNPADFLIDASGRVVFAHYGKHYADSLEASDVVEAWRSVQREMPMPNALVWSGTRITRRDETRGQDERLEPVAAAGQGLDEPGRSGVVLERLASLPDGEPARFSVARVIQVRPR